MNRIRWVEKSIRFENLIKDPNIKKPILVRIGRKLFIVGEKLHGKFLVASVYKQSNNGNTSFDHNNIILSREHNGLWKVISKSRLQNQCDIHRLTTKDIQIINEKDFQNQRTISRTYICTKDIEAFELCIRLNDFRIVNGQRVDRQIKDISKNIQFEITDIGKIEYTPTEGERTSQDYVFTRKAKSDLLQLFLPIKIKSKPLIQNRIIRTLHCKTLNESRKRYFHLEVNEKPCDIQPIASKGSTELRYLQSTENLFDYMLHYENDSELHVKLIRGDIPIKSIASDGFLIFKRILTGDQIPLCCVDNLETFLIPSNLPIQIKLPMNDSNWDTLPEIRAAKVQCMQLSLALFARHESEIYVRTNFQK